MGKIKQIFLAVLIAASIGLKSDRSYNLPAADTNEYTFPDHDYISRVMGPDCDNTPTNKKVIQKGLPDTTGFSSGDIYLLMFNADTVHVKNREGGKRFRSNIDSLYKSFRTIGVPQENFWVYQGGKKNPGYVRGKASRENIWNGINQISKKAGLDDLIIIYGTNHGEDHGIEGSKIQLDNHKYITDSEIQMLCNQINSAAVIAFMPACKNYFAAYNVAEGNIIGISASGPNKNSSSGKFSKKFAEAIVRSTDTDGDGNVSLMEIFDYATTNYPEAYMRDFYGTKKETPHLIYDRVDPKNVIIKKGISGNN